MTLAKIRSRIDELDEQILDILSERCSIMDQVIVEKMKTGEPIFQPKRELEILERRRAQAKARGLPVRMVEEITSTIMRFSKELQAKKAKD